jgi:hypothetical protein
MQLADSATAYTAGLIHDLGKFALAYANFTALDDITNRVPDEFATWREAEKVILGFESTQVTKALLENWGFPSTFVSVGEFYQTPSECPDSERKIATLIHAAKHVATQIGYGVGVDGFYYEPDEDALKVFAGKKNLRLLIAELPDPRRPGLMLKPISGGMLVQSRDNGAVLRASCEVVTQRTPTDAEWVDLMFAWTVARHVKSNAIVYANGGATAGIGAGQMSRVDSSRIAVWKASEAGLDLQGSVIASDAMFPFADGLQTAIDAGVSACIQPGGSKNDEEVIAAADAAGIAMVFTGFRHFRH